MAEPKFLDHPGKCDGPVVPAGHKPIYIAPNLMFISFWAQCKGCGSSGYVDVAVPKLYDEVQKLCVAKIDEFYKKPVTELAWEAHPYLDSDKSVPIKSSLIGV